MIKQLNVYSSNIADEPYTLATEGAPETDPFQIRGITGLNPVAAEIATSKKVNSRGEKKTGSSTGKRNVVLSVAPNPDWSTYTHESLRIMLDKIFMPESDLRMEFESTHLPTVEIFGTVETFEQDIFAKDLEYQISILCEDPDFVEVDTTTIGALTGSIPTEIDYPGNQDCGFVVRLSLRHSYDTFDGDITMVNEALGKTEVMVINDVHLDSTSQYLEISTVPGDKYANILLASVLSRQNALYKIPLSSSWPKLKPGINNFYIDSPPMHMTWDLKYRPRYGGL